MRSRGRLVDGCGVVEIGEGDELHSSRHRERIDRARVDARYGDRGEQREARRRASARAAGSSSEGDSVVPTASLVRWSSATAASAEPMPSPRRDGSTESDRGPASGSGCHQQRAELAQPRISPRSSKANIACSARAGTAARRCRIPSSVMIDSGQARWRIAAARERSSGVPSRITRPPYALVAGGNHGPLRAGHGRIVAGGRG